MMSIRDDDANLIEFYPRCTADLETLTSIFGNLARMKAYNLGFVGREDALCKVIAAEGAYYPFKDRNPTILKSRGHSKQPEAKESYWTPLANSLRPEGYFREYGLLNYGWSGNYSGVAVSRSRRLLVSILKI